MAEVLVPAGPLERFIEQVCRAVGTDEKAAAEVAHHLVRANLSGHDSHGVLRMPWYVQQVQGGVLKPEARPEIVRQRGATALLDARQSFGQYSTMVALEWAIGAAKEHGIATAAIRNSMHIGRLGEYSERAVAAGMVAIVAYGAAGPGSGIVVPFGGRERFLGTNPWSFGIPAGDGGLMLYDAATSTIAEGKIRVARSKGAQLPAGCIIDESGLPSTQPEDFYAGGALLPLGGDVGGHKGYGLALTAALLGGLAQLGNEGAGSWDLGARHGRADAAQAGPSGHITGVVLIVIDPSFFGDAAQYGAMTGATLAAAREVRPAEGVQRVLTPGEPEQISRERREREGIPLPDTIWEELGGLAAQFNLTLPEPVRG